ncbi:hypothetical protein M434DRAFT_37596 [Hypoxylon sp. CO27-5]|nr:hypothetical protein M434DRAFT_37596 [Hypoxylon sp. CO27-5]
MNSQIYDSTRTPSPSSQTEASAIKVSPRVSPKQVKKVHGANRAFKKIKLVGSSANYRIRAGSTKIKPTRPLDQPRVQPTQEDIRPKLPRYIKVYQDGCRCRLRSIYDHAEKRYIYHYEKDASKPIEMTFSQDKIVALRNTETGESIWIHCGSHTITTITSNDGDALALEHWNLELY